MSPGIISQEVNGRQEPTEAARDERHGRRRRVAVVGAGLVGSLAALNFARMGNDVDLYEYREDIRQALVVQGRSINLALSQRGRKALAAVGLEQEVLGTAIPMRGRMLHDVRGNSSVVLYDPINKQCLYSVGRRQLNEDKSFTVTLSMPFEIFASIQNQNDLLAFFRLHFRDALPLIGEQQLIKDFFKTRPQFLVSIKCRPYHYADKALILGDAAHAMVPYYGQGMNAGMEDVTLLTDILAKQLPLDETLALFTESRWQDAFAICDLAMYNYVEMRDLTKRWTFRLRKWLDTLLFRLFPGWIPLYNSVSFSSMPYRQCIANRKWQDQLLKRISGATILTAIVTGGAIYAQRFL
ncbi:GD10220 [Drosophila simulans]|uniref:GD10220 n=1 Tax=Drosophila simulans TaxID=7240 RepID=B4QES4_DROSI|nr:GD10220 [Drosophila simulans]